MRITIYRTELDEKEHNCLIKERAYHYKEHTCFTQPEEIADMMCQIFGIQKKAEEFMFQIALNIKGKVLGVFELSHGTINACLVGVRELMIRNILCGAAHFILVHNHPSGIVEPSKEDLLLTKRIEEAGELLGIPLADHIIIGRKNRGWDEGIAYVSMREAGFITSE